MIGWPKGEPYDSFIKLARKLPMDEQSRIFEPCFQRRVVQQVKISYDPKIVPKLENLIQGRCNYPSELTVRTGQWRDRGKARCKKTLRDGYFFCHIASHQDFAWRHGLPLHCKDDEVKPKPKEEQRGYKKDDDPLRPSFRNHGPKVVESTKARRPRKPRVQSQIVKRGSKKVLKIAEPAQVEKIKATAAAIEPDDSCEISKIVDGLISLNLPASRGPNSSPETVAATVTKPEVDLIFQCVFCDPITGVKCQAEGAFPDPESPGCSYCCDHIFVSEELLERMKKTRNDAVYRDFATIHRLDKQLQALGGIAGSGAVVQRRELSVRRFVLASNNGLGTHPMLQDWIRSKGAIV